MAGYEIGQIGEKISDSMGNLFSDPESSEYILIACSIVGVLILLSLIFNCIQKNRTTHALPNRDIPLREKRRYST